KQHCTFCGLNGSGMAFRSRPPAVVQQELTAAVRRQRTLDVLTVDNIMDQRYFSTLLPALAETGWDLRPHYELKANLQPEQLETLRRAGVWHVQPGIESLSSRVLGLMRKGITGCRNVETLREGAEQGLTVAWNWLYGFPGETAADYGAVLEQ